MDDANPYAPSDTDAPVNPQNNKRVARKMAGIVAISFGVLLCCVLGAAAGALAGFFIGLAIFTDAGDFTMMFVMPCILIGAVAGGAVGAVVGALFTGFINSKNRHL